MPDIVIATDVGGFGAAAIRTGVDGALNEPVPEAFMAATRTKYVPVLTANEALGVELLVFDTAFAQEVPFVEN